MKKIVFALLVVFACASNAQAAILYALSDFNNSTGTLYTIDTTNPTTATLVGTTGVQAGFGLADYNGRLFSFDQVSDTIVEINPLTGGTVSSQAFGNNLVGEGSISIDSNGSGFVTASSGSTGTMYSFTVGTAGSSLVGGLSVSMDGMDIDGSGTIYGLSQTNNDLYTINGTNANVSLVGNSGLNGGVLAGLTFDSAGNLFAITSGGSLYSVDANNGSATLLGNTGLSSVSGLSALSPIPEPLSLLVWGFLGLIGLGYVRRRRRA